MGAERNEARVEFEGVVDVWGGGLTDAGPRVAGRDVIQEVNEAFPDPRGRYRTRTVKVYLGVEPIAEGLLWAIHGFGGTDVTPPEMPEIEVGDYDLLKRLQDLDGRTVALVVEVSVNDDQKG